MDPLKKPSLSGHNAIGALVTHYMETLRQYESIVNEQNLTIAALRQEIQRLQLAASKLDINKPETT